RFEVVGPGGGAETGMRRRQAKGPARKKLEKGRPRFERGKPLKKDNRPAVAALETLRDAVPDGARTGASRPGPVLPRFPSCAPPRRCMLARAFLPLQDSGRSARSPDGAKRNPGFVPGIVKPGDVKLPPGLGIDVTVSRLVGQ